MMKKTIFILSVLFVFSFFLVSASSGVEILNCGVDASSSGCGIVNFTCSIVDYTGAQGISYVNFYIRARYLADMYDPTTYTEIPDLISGTVKNGVWRFQLNVTPVFADVSEFTFYGVFAQSSGGAVCEGFSINDAEDCLVTFASQIVVENTCACGASQTTGDCTIDNLYETTWDIHPACEDTYNYRLRGCDYCDPLWTPYYGACTVTNDTIMIGDSVKYYDVGVGDYPNGSSCCGLTVGAAGDLFFNHDGGSDCTPPGDAGLTVSCYGDNWLLPGKDFEGSSKNNVPGQKNNVPGQSTRNQFVYDSMTEFAGSYGSSDFQPIVVDLDNDGISEIVILKSGNLRIYNLNTNTGTLFLKASTTAGNIIGPVSIRGMEQKYSSGGWEYWGCSDGTDPLCDSQIIAGVSVGSPKYIYTYNYSAGSLVSDDIYTLPINVTQTYLKKGNGISCKGDNCYFVAYRLSGGDYYNLLYELELSTSTFTVFDGSTVGTVQDSTNVTPILLGDKIIFWWYEESLEGMLRSMDYSGANQHYAYPGGYIIGATYNRNSSEVYVTYVSSSGVYTTFSVASWNPETNGLTKTRDIWTGLSSSSCITAPASAICKAKEGFAFAHYNGQSTGATSQEDFWYGLTSDGGEKKYNYASASGSVWDWYSSKSITKGNNEPIYADVNNDGSPEFFVLDSGTLYAYNKNFVLLDTLAVGDDSFYSYSYDGAVRGQKIFAYDLDYDNIKEIGLFSNYSGSPMFLTIEFDGSSLTFDKNYTFSDFYEMPGMNTDGPDPIVVESDGDIGLFWTSYQRYGDMWIYLHKLDYSSGSTFDYDFEMMTYCNSTSVPTPCNYLGGLSSGDIKDNGTSTIVTFTKEAHMVPTTSVENILMMYDFNLNQIRNKTLTTGVYNFPRIFIYQGDDFGDREVIYQRDYSISSISGDQRIYVLDDKLASVCTTNNLGTFTTPNIYGLMMLPVADFENMVIYYVRDPTTNGVAYANDLKTIWTHNCSTKLTIDYDETIYGRTEPNKPGWVVNVRNHDYWVNRVGVWMKFDSSDVYDDSYLAGSPGRPMILDVNADGYMDMLWSTTGESHLYLQNSSSSIYEPFTSYAKCMTGDLTSYLQVPLSGTTCKTATAVSTADVNKDFYWDELIMGGGLIDFRTQTILRNFTENSVVIPVDVNRDTWGDFIESSSSGTSVFISNPPSEKIAVSNTVEITNLQPCSVDDQGILRLGIWGKAVSPDDVKYVLNPGDGSIFKTKYYSSDEDAWYFDHYYDNPGTYTVEAKICDESVNLCDTETCIADATNIPDRSSGACSLGDAGTFDWTSRITDYDWFFEPQRYNFDISGFGTGQSPVEGQLLMNVNEQFNFIHAISCDRGEMTVSFKTFHTSNADQSIVIGAAGESYNPGDELYAPNVLAIIKFDNGELKGFEGGYQYTLIGNYSSSLWELYHLTLDLTSRKYYLYKENLNSGDITLIFESDFITTDIISSFDSAYIELDYVYGVTKFDFIEVVGEGTEVSEISVGETIASLKVDGYDEFAYLNNCGAGIRYSASVDAGDPSRSFPAVEKFCESGKDKFCDYGTLQKVVKLSPKCHEEALNYCVAVTYPREEEVSYSDNVASEGLVVCSAVIGASELGNKIVSPLIKMLWRSVTANIVTALLVITLIIFVVAIFMGGKK